MITNVNFCEFCDSFKVYDRQDNFTYAGKKALFDYLEQYEQDTGKQVQMDIIALCCEYTEYADIATVISEYDCIDNIDDLQDHTMVIEFDEGIIIQQF